MKLKHFDELKCFMQSQISCENVCLFGNRLLIVWDFFISVEDKLFFQFENAAVFL